MSDNDSWTPEEIARANERQKEINEKKERENKLLEERKIKEAVNSPSAKAGGFGLRLKAGFDRPNGSITPL